MAERLPTLDAEDGGAGTGEQSETDRLGGVRAPAEVDLTEALTVMLN